MITEQQYQEYQFKLSEVFDKYHGLKDFNGVTIETPDKKILQIASIFSSEYVSSNQSVFLQVAEGASYLSSKEVEMLIEILTECLPILKEVQTQALLNE